MTQELTFGLVVSPRHKTWERNVELWTLGESLGPDSMWLMVTLEHMSGGRVSLARSDDRT